MPKMQMKGGFLDSLQSSFTNGWNSLSQSVSNTYNKTKNAVTGSSSYSVGGKTRKYRGGYTASKAVNHASHVSHIKTASPHKLTGGRSKKQRKHKHSKSCKHNKK